ncbi:SRPBCC domain-containing protein [Mucilaginibacter mali]|uniref:SRPBCC domain-containing protein n=1 Tax=Mucilaginibacter mali TaxID=2740462 RepID=A0A7D4TLV0_9SPHI|nr:SRPBCC family protein [Mucilaginibacter mali]QKJ28594.1 SRPBCC domain-containing protein [Mucilaginibacter mali]
METTTHSPITIEATVNAPVAKVWEYWNSPEHITQWCAASDDWHAPYSDNDPRTGGTFKTTMAAKDGSFSFDFGGEYSNVVDNQLMEYAMGDGRKVKVVFEDQGDSTRIIETFDPENQNPIEMQRGGWQAILDNFKRHTETN